MWELALEHFDVVEQVARLHACDDSEFGEALYVLLVHDFEVFDTDVGLCFWADELCRVEDGADGGITDGVGGEGVACTGAESDCICNLRGVHEGCASGVMVERLCEGIEHPSGAGVEGAIDEDLAT